jgi:enterochelin esterase family protein
VGPFKEVGPLAEQGLRNYKLFTKDLLEQIIPTVEKNYRVYADADHRAIGGLSMGAMQSISIGLAHPELFHYVLAYSGGFGSLGVVTASADVESQAPWKELLADPAQAKKSLRLLFLGCGQDEAGLLTPGKKLTSLLQAKGLHVEWRDHPGGHVFSVWRHHLNESAPLLFRK